MKALLLIAYVVGGAISAPILFRVLFEDLHSISRRFGLEEEFRQRDKRAAMVLALLFATLWPVGLISVHAVSEFGRRNGVWK